MLKFEERVSTPQMGVYVLAKAITGRVKARNERESQSKATHMDYAEETVSVQNVLKHFQSKRKDRQRCPGTECTIPYCTSVLCFFSFRITSEVSNNPTRLIVQDQLDKHTIPVTTNNKHETN